MAGFLHRLKLPLLLKPIYGGQVIMPAGRPSDLRRGERVYWQAIWEHMTRMMRKILVGAGATAMMWSAMASAHAKLVSASPAPDATVSAAQHIHLQFSDELVAKFSSFRLTDTDGDPVPMMLMKARDAKSLDAMPTSKLAAGIYTVTWTAVSTDDGHKTMGSYSFTVQ